MFDQGSEIPIMDRIENDLVISVSRLKEKLNFLKKVLKNNILLPSNFKKGIDRDLLILQQERKLKLCLKKIKDQIFIKQNTSYKKTYEIIKAKTWIFHSKKKVIMPFL